MRRIVLWGVVWMILLTANDVSALRSEKPQPFSRWDCPSFTRLNNTLSDFWNILNGRYNLDSITTDPNGNRNGTRGELVYSFFSGDEYLCVNSSSPSPGTTWTCVNITTFGTLCGGVSSDTEILYNDNGSCGGDPANVFDETTGSVGIGGTGTPGATLELDPADVTGNAAEDIEFLSSNQSIGMASGTTLATQRQNQFIAPTINGVAGGATETVTNAATVYIDAAPSGSNITLTTSSDILFGETTTTAALLKVQDETSSNTTGRGLAITGANGNGTGVGGAINLTSGTGGSSNGNGGALGILAGSSNGTGTGGNLTIDGGEALGSGQGGSITIAAGFSDTGTGGNVTIRSGDVTNAGGTLGSAGQITIDAMDGDNTGAGGTVQISSGSPGASRSSGSLGAGIINLAPGNVTSYFTPYTSAPILLNGSTLTVTNGATISDHRQTYVAAPTINGVAGGSTETVTNAATLYVNAAPAGSNITFTNGPYAFWSDAGRNRFDGYVDMFASATVTGILTVDGEIRTDDIVTSSRTTDFGWTVQTAANQACTTTCISAAVFGQDTDTTNGPIVGPSDATADRCLCAGAN